VPQDQARKTAKWNNQRLLFLTGQLNGKNLSKKKNPEPQIYLEGPEIAKTTFFFSTARATPGT